MTQVLEKKLKKATKPTPLPEVKSDWLKRDIRIYISGPYTGNTEINVIDSIEASWKLMSKGYTVVCPHLYHYVDKQHPTKWTREQWVTYVCKLLAMCDCIYMIGKWSKSEGCKAEMQYATEHFIPILKTSAELEIFKENWYK